MNNYHYNLDNVTISNTTQYITLYLVDTNTSKLTQINVKDSIGNTVSGAQITVQRFYPANASYQTVTITGETGNDGNVMTYLVPNDVYYRFTVTESDGSTQAFSPQQVSCSDSADLCFVYLRLGTGTVGDYYEYAPAGNTEIVGISLPLTNEMTSQVTDLTRVEGEDVYQVESHSEGGQDLGGARLTGRCRCYHCGRW